MKISPFNKSLFTESLTYISIYMTVIAFLAIFYQKLFIDSSHFFIVPIVLIYIVVWAKENFRTKTTIKIYNSQLEIKYGDLFSTSGLKVIPFNEYFDTIVDDDVIASSSLNGVLINKFYKNDTKALDGMIASELSRRNVNPEKIYSTRTKGKQSAYKLGTCVTLDSNYIVTALTHFDENNRAFLYKNDYLTFWITFWDEIDKIYNSNNIVIPLMGSGITRFKDGHELSAQDLLEQIISSFYFSNFKPPHNCKVSIILPDNLRNTIDLYTIKKRYQRK